MPPEPSLEPSSKEPPAGDAPAPPPQEGLCVYLKEALGKAEPPLTRNRLSRYGKEFKEAYEKGAERAVLWRAAERIRERWNDSDHYKLSVEDAIGDVLNGKGKKNGGVGGASPSAAPQGNDEAAARRRKEGYEWLFR